MAIVSREIRYIVRDDKGIIIGNYSSIVIIPDARFYLAKEREEGLWLVLNEFYRRPHIPGGYNGYKIYEPYDDWPLEVDQLCVILQDVDTFDNKVLNVKYLLVNFLGETIYKCEEVYLTDSHYLIVKNKGKYGLIDEYCEEIIPCIYDTKEAIPHDLFTKINQIKFL